MEQYYMNNGTDNKMRINMILNVIKGALSVIFPLITYPYVSRVLGVNNLGRFNFSQSIVSYVSLIAGLGFTSYIIRDGSAKKNSKEKFDSFISEVFSLNIITTFIAYIVLGISLLISVKLRDYSVLILILSLYVFLQTIGVEWIYTIFEDFLHVTIRIILIQISSLIMLFLFVKNEEDLINYAILNVVALAGANIWNFFDSRKRYAKIEFTIKCHPKEHIIPSLFFFAISIFNTIYVSSDVTILGYLCSDYEVGLYGVSVNIYKLLKGIIASALVVGLSRLSAYADKSQKEEFQQTASDLLSMALTITLPAITGVVFFSKEIIMIIAGKEYIGANASLKVLAITLLFSLLAYFWLQCVLISYHMEKVVLVITAISAILNIVLNLLLIPSLKQDAAAITTLISEGTVVLIGFYLGKKYVRISDTITNFLKSILGCFIIAMISYISVKLIHNSFISFIVSIVLSAVAYLVVEMLLKNDGVYPIYDSVLKRIKKGSNNEKE